MSYGPRWNRCWSGTIRGSMRGDGDTAGVQEADARRCRRARFLPRLCMRYGRAASGRRCRASLAVQAPSIPIFNVGDRTVFFCVCGKLAWPSMTKWQASHGSGRAWMGLKERPRWPRRRWGTTRPIGGKKGTKRSLLVDARGAPLSLIVAGANRHDVKLLPETLDAIVIRRPRPTRTRPQNLCVDKGYAGKPALQQMLARRYIPHVPPKGTSKPRRRTRGKKARRWVVERTHSWMNNYRKLRVRYEKKAANFEGLLHLAAALICWRM